MPPQMNVRSAQGPAASVAARTERMGIVTVIPPAALFRADRGNTILDVLAS
jgi:hypothetical protein